MKRTGIFILCLIVLTFPFIFTGCSDDVDYNAVIAAQVGPMQKRIEELEKNFGDLTKRIKAQEDRQFPAAQDLSPYVTKANEPQNFLDNVTQAQLDTLKTRLGITGTSTTPTNPTTTSQVTGQVSYTVLNAQQWYTFNTQGIIAVRITNGKSESRYIRPQLTMTIYPASTTPAVLTNATCVVTSNSQGQPAIVYGSAGQGTPITSWAACQQLLFIPTSGGMLAGQYLLGSGTSMDIYMTVTITPAYPGLWTLNVSGTDVSMSGI